MYSHMVTSFVASVVAATVTYQVQEWKFDSKEKAHVESQLANVRLSAAASIRRQDNVIEAQNEATARMVRLRRDADNVRTQLARLRNALDMPRPNTSTVTQDACPEPANPLKELFSQCAGDLTDLAEKADRHTSDVKTLVDSWRRRR